MAPTTPSSVGPYLIRGVIGSGAMGVVYLGHDPAIDRPVAIKTIHRRLLESGGEDSNVTARFRVEAKAAGRLTHRNIVPVYQFGEENDLAYISIKDHGIGIEPSSLETIFDPYVRASNKSTGSGLGLYLAMKAAKIIGGTITVTSTLNNGSEFLVAIPAR